MNINRSNQPQIVDTLRISDNEVATVLNQLDQQRIDKPDETRDNRRVNLRLGPGLIVQVHQPGGTTANFLVRPRNISEKGLAFIHGGFLHRDSLCTVLLNTKGTGRIKVDGRVVRCRHIRANLHEIGLQLVEEIDLEHAVAFPPDPPAAAVDSTKLTGKLLLIEPNDDDRAYLQVLLEGLGVSVVAVSTAPKAMQRYKAEPRDVVMIDLDHVIETTADFVNNLRDAGYSGPIVGVTVNHKPQLVRAALGLGVDKLLTKPFGAQTLRHTLGPMFGGSPAGESPLHSEHADHPMMESVLADFLGHLDGYCKQLTELRESLDGDRLQTVGLQLKSSAANLGYPLIAAAAFRLHELAEVEPDAEAIKQQIEELIALATLARKAQR